MLRPRNAILFKKPLKPDSRRKHGRVICEMVSCSLGEVLDACAAGVRVRAGKEYEYRIGDIIVFTISGEDRPLTFKGRVMWTKRRGIRKFEMGIQFIELTELNRLALAQLARGAVFNTTFFTSINPSPRII